MRVLPMELHNRPRRRLGRDMCCARFVAVILALGAVGADRGDPWPRHAIDGGGGGCDGVRLADVNGDGLPDVTSGWEQSGISRAYLHPGYDAVTDPWPAVTVGSAPNVEDAVFADLDGDGAMDVISSCEGGTRAVFVHWAPSDPADYLNPALWQTAMIPASAGWLWMYAVPMQVDGENGIDIVVGAKEANAKVAWFESPPGDPRNLSAWTMHVMARALNASRSVLFPVALSSYHTASAIPFPSNHRCISFFWDDKF